MFVGRRSELRTLEGILSKLTDRGGATQGRALLIRGRRRVGKSRLVEEFLDRAQIPSLFFAASGRPVTDELGLFAEEAAASSLPGASLFRGVRLSSWDSTLRLLVSALPDEKPSVVVLDELPYLIANDPDIEGTLQRVFDRELSRKPVLFIGIGSDLAMMEALNEYGRPFHQRAREMVIPPLSPAEVRAMVGLGPAESFDAFLVTGGLPLNCADWEPGMSVFEFLEREVNDPTSALLVSAERSLAAEFPSEAQARTVLQAIGTGERTFANIGRAAGQIQQASLNRALDLLQRKRIVAGELPLSTKASREKRYRIADPYLRFWLNFLGPRIGEIERGRGDRVMSAIETSWTSWRGRAIEPVIRDALERLSPPQFESKSGTLGVVGGYWTRSNNPEIDLVVGDRAPIAKEIVALGSVKWLEDAPFDAHDLSKLQHHRTQLPGANDDSPLIAVSRSGVSVEGVEVFGPEELLEAYRQ